MKIKFTQKFINGLSCDKTEGRQFYRDTICRGLVCEVRSTSGKTYYYSYRDKRSKQRLLKIGNANDITPSVARELCDRRRQKLSEGIDPISNKKSVRICPKYSDFFYDKYLPYAKGYKKSWETDLFYARTHIMNTIGNVYLDEITVAHIHDVISVCSNRLAPASVYRVFTIIRYSLNLAIKWRVGSIKENPADQYKLKRPNDSRQYYLDDVQTKRILFYVNTSQNRMLRYIIPLILLTGARIGEILPSRWADFDIERRYWRIPISKNGSERYIPLGDTAIQILKNVPRFHRCEYVFPNPNTLKPYTCIRHTWNTVRTLAKLPHIRLHDLRHSFASYLVNSGCNLYEVQKILGHKSIAMTERYSHLNQSSLLRAVSLAEPYVDIEMTKWNRETFEARKLQKKKSEPHAD